MPGWFTHFPAERPQLSVVRIYPYRRRLRIDSLSRTLTDYMVSREFLASILSLPYPWYDFLVATFTLYLTLTNLQSAGQPSASAVSLFYCAPFALIDISLM
jgi:hypothetical protein